MAERLDTGIRVLERYCTSLLHMGTEQVQMWRAGAAVPVLLMAGQTTQ